MIKLWPQFFWVLMMIYIISKKQKEYKLHKSLLNRKKFQYLIIGLVFFCFVLYSGGFFDTLIYFLKK